MDRQVGEAWTEDRVIDILRELAREEELPAHLVEGAILATDTVESLGIDSIGAVALIDRLEDRANVHLPDDFLDIDESVASIAARMNSLNA